MTQVTVRGAATAEEVAAVLAVLARVGEPEPPADAYRRWRETRRRSILKDAFRPT